MKYNWQQKDWPAFTYNLRNIEDALFSFAEETGHIGGVLKGLPENVQMQTIIDIMVSEAIKTSEIEGEYLSRPDVISSIKNNLGLNKNQEKIKDKRSEGAGKLMVEIRNSFSLPLTEQDLFLWHKMLMTPHTRIKTGEWRTHKEPMQVVSGAMGKEKVHFEAPPSSRIPFEMKKFIKWFNDTAPGEKKK